MGKTTRWQTRQHTKRELDAEEIFERKFGRSKEKGKQRPAVLQASPTDNPVAESGLLYWCGGSFNDYIPISDYSDPARQRDLQLFALLAPMILNAEAVVIKKMQSLVWEVIGSRNTAYRWQEILNNIEEGQGWSVFLARWLRGYLESDRGGFAEIIRAAPAWATNESGYLTERGIEAMRRGEDAAWQIVGAKTLDPVQCQFTTSHEFPLVYTNPYTGRRHYLRNYNFLHIMDMPSPAINSGVCAVSRAVYAAQLDRFLNRYVMEKVSENPGAGIVFANASAEKIESALKAAQNERQARGVAFYKGIIFIPVLNPDGNFGVEFLRFSELPGGFEYGDMYNAIKEVVAASFGLDVLELGSIPGKNLGTASQAAEAALKSRSKVLESLTAQIEREFRYKIIPESVEFRFRVQNLMDRIAEAQFNSVHFDNALKLAEISNPRLARQYLVDTGIVPEAYLEAEDITSEVAVADDAPKKSIKQAVKPARGNLRALTDADAEVTQEDVDRAVAGWDDLFAGTEFANLLSARRVDE